MEEKLRGRSELINAILADHGLPPAAVESIEGTVHGYVIDEPGSARSSLDPLIDLFGLAVIETAQGFVFRGETEQAATVQITEMVSDGRDAVMETVRSPDHQLPSEAVLSFRDPLIEYQTISVNQTRSGAPGRSHHAIGFPGSMEAGQGRALIGNWLRRAWAGRESIAFAVAQPNAAIVPGAIVRLPGSELDYLVTEIEDGLVRRVSARQIVRAAPTAWQSANPDAVSTSVQVVGQPLAVFLDLPMGLESRPAEDHFRLAAWQSQWKSQAAFASPEDTGFAQRTTVDQPADIGVLVEALPPGVCGRIDHSADITVELYHGAFSSVSRAQLLNGANGIAVRSAGGVWEIVQFETAEEIEPDIWKLGGLLRGQLGTDDATAAGAEAGAHVVVLNEAVQAAGLTASEIGLLLNWRVGSSGGDFSSANFSDHSETGGLRALLPLSPVHPRATMDPSGDLAIGWTRRGRLGADSWTANDITLGEEREEYRVEIAHAGGSVVRATTSPTPGYVYEAADIAADFGAPPAEIDVTVRQLSLAAGWGIPATRRLSLS